MDSSAERPSKCTRSAHGRRTLDTYKTPEAVNSATPIPPSVLERIYASLRASEPLIIRLQFSPAERAELLQSWSSYVAAHRLVLQQTAGRTAPVLPLGEAWNTSRRIESGLKGRKRRTATLSTGQSCGQSTLGWTVHCPLDCPVDSVKIYCPPSKINENARFCEIGRDSDELM